MGTVIYWLSENGKNHTHDPENNGGRKSMIRGQKNISNKITKFCLNGNLSCSIINNRWKPRPGDGAAVNPMNQAKGTTSVFLPPLT
jgi:hypothetical protein